ncbi:SpaH/EbpB family LPXTG-anchored major pilin [Gemmiger sp.]|uniref:SpaH/EbpB family LPXTG-anchored major pilin n=1 Tax=Gemmiger sp. TaxID=2049027 RepID=UPI002E7904C8|nr:SpaH/EbpB family LPXTG-anchored major pilin [Gemmiger sp.]MEE1422739.1 SpaH/EbpB family LPXTG-anchored major pilin [Gemmiger sp.]
MKLKRLLTAALSAVMALSVCALPAMAEESGATATTTPKKTASVIDTGKTGSITIYKYNTTTATAQGETGTGETQTPPAGATALRGAEFTIYQVKDETWLAKYYGGEALTPEEKTPVVDDYFQKDAGGQVTSYEAANLVVDIAAKAKGTQVTDEKGYAKFDNLDLGLYLVIETKVPQSVVTAVTPFLVSVPMTRVQTGNTATEGQLKEWLYDVTVYPKNSTVKGTIYLEKKGVIGNDKANETALPGVKFKLERLNDGVELTKAVDADWTLIKPAKKGSEEQKEYFVTGSEGKIEVADLTPGTYRFTELGYETKQDNKYIVNGGDRYVFVVGKDGHTVSKPTDAAYTSNGDYEVNNATTGTVKVYNYAPDVDKQVQKHGDASTWQDAADYNVGDKIPYKITVTVPENITRLKTFVVKDTPTNLDDDKGTIQVQHVDSTTGTTTLNQGTSENPGEIKEIREIVGSNSDKGFEIEFNPAKMATYAGKEIVITYTATLKDTAVSTTAGNTNKVSLVYSNKVKTDNSPETEGDKKQVQDETVVYTFKIKINKTNESGKGLNGVEFDLYKEVPAGTTNAITDNKAKALGLDSSKSWLKVNTQPLTTKTVGSENGILEVNGLANGTYKIVETKTLKDYNLLKEPVDVTLSIAYKTTWTKTDTYSNGVCVKTEVKKAQEDFTTGRESTNGGTQSGENGIGMISKTIINRKGFNLPVTGGFGTLLFSGIGVLLVLAGVCVLFSLKKKNNRA